MPIPEATNASGNTCCNQSAIGGVRAFGACSSSCSGLFYILKMNTFLRFIRTWSSRNETVCAAKGRRQRFTLLPLVTKISLPAIKFAV